MNEIDLRQIVSDGMRKAIIEGNEEVRVIWRLDEVLYPYTLEVKDRVKGWVPLVAYDSLSEAMAGMLAIIESNRKE